VNPVPGPVILLALPLIAAVVTYLLRRWPFLAASGAAVVAAALAFLCIRLPLDRSAFVLGQEVAFGRPIVIIGRNLILEPMGQVWLAVVYTLAVIYYLIASRLAQGRLFFSFSLVILSLYALVTLLETFSLAILVLTMTACPAVFMVQGDRPGSVRGSLRYLTVTLLAVPLLLTAAWLADQSALSAANAQMARLAILPAALGFGLLLAVFPFGTWMPALAADAPPLVSAFLFTAGQAMAGFVALVFLRELPWPLADPNALELIQFVGLVTAVSAGLMAAAQRDFGRVLGYAAMSDLGFALIAFGSGGSSGQGLALLHIVNRSAPIALMAASLAIVRNHAATDAFGGLQGMARRLPIATMGLLVGGLGLAGFPMTAGFPTHWAIMRSVSITHWPWAWLLLASSAGIVVALLRGWSAMLGADSGQHGARQPVVASFMIVALIALVILIGWHPQFFLAPIQKAVEALALF
jgi:formate hydrogenlyase subunit 3/multisubunit Na+/H+ antiporter MnhD subunit